MTNSKSTKRALIISVLAIFMCVAMLIGTTFAWFTDSAEVSSAVLTLLLPFFIYQFGDGLQINYANALRGIADVKPLMVIAFIAFFVISLPVGYLCGFVMGYGLVGVWMAFPFGLTSAGVMMWWRFRQQMRLNKN